MAIRVLLRFRATHRIEDTRSLGLRVNPGWLAKSIFHFSLAGIFKAVAGCTPPSDDCPWRAGAYRSRRLIVPTKISLGDDTMRPCSRSRDVYSHG